MTAPAISAHNLGHAYGDFVALHHLDLEVPSGRIGLVGANGAGKTTLIKILLGILHPTVGNVAVLGVDPEEDVIAVRSRIGYMPEGECLPKDQTAADFISYAAELAGVPPNESRQRASDILTMVGLHEERFRYFGDFSTGMKQRAMLAQAIVHDPEMVFLDEPTAGLDPAGREEMLDLIGRLGGFGINVLVSSHVLPDIEQTCDWVVMLDGGQVLRSGPLTGLTETGVVELEVVDSIEDVAAELRRMGAEVDTIGEVLTIRSIPGDPFLAARDALATTGVALRRLGARSTTLEDIFLGEVPDHE
ncbi:MAG: ABC transporter ATP-binding protein [Acidimicrobiia bacterium]|nr:ABC transporter ATP-binding protein [Acidimicrobiia bacterium]MDX2467333.1 ABC transporter ATP-binding protein [Acidimicrobiia bacterium]